MGKCKYIFGEYMVNMQKTKETQLSMCVTQHICSCENGVEKELIFQNEKRRI